MRIMAQAGSSDCVRECPVFRDLGVFFFEGGRADWGSGVEAQVWLGGLGCWLARQLFVLSSV